MLDQHGDMRSCAVCDVHFRTVEDTSLCSRHRAEGAGQADRDRWAIDPWDEGRQDPAAHYRHTVRAAITDDDIARGYTEVKLDPYRVCDIYATGGGPREQMIKKLLRWTDKGQPEDKVIAEIESALKRWKEMRAEDAACRGQ